MKGSLHGMILHTHTLLHLPSNYNHRTHSFATARQFILAFFTDVMRCFLTFQRCPAMPPAERLEDV